MSLFTLKKSLEFQTVSALTIILSVNASQCYASNVSGSIKATVLIETILAAFEMDEILYELREHSAGLNGKEKTRA